MAGALCFVLTRSRVQPSQTAVIEKDDRRNNWLWLLAGLAFFLISNGRWIVPAAAWLAPIFLLRFTRSARSWVHLLALLTLMCVAARVMLYGIIPNLGLLTLALTVYYGLLWFLPYLIDRWLVRSSGTLSTLVFPCAYVAVEYVQAVANGSWGAIAYSQVENLPLLQLSAVTGMWGITFVITWTAACAVTMWDEWTRGRRPWRLAASVAAVLAIVLLGGGLRIARAPSGDSIAVASFTAAAQLDDLRSSVRERGFTDFAELAKVDRPYFAGLLDNLYPDIFRRTREAASPGVRVVMWPEEGIDVLEEVEPTFLDSAQNVARTADVHLLLAYRRLPLEDPTRGAENAATLIAPDGTVRFKYLKTHPVPGVTEVPGDGKLPLEQTPFGLISTAICYDMDFTGLIHQAGRADVDLMLVPAWDWRAIDPLHARMAVVRAVENGFSMVRETAFGLSVAVDAYGRVRAEKDYFEDPNALMLAHVPGKGVRTVYAYIGDLFAWLCIAGLFAAVIARYARKKATDVPSSEAG